MCILKKYSGYPAVVLFLFSLFAPGNLHAGAHAVMILLDASGSMAGDKFEYAKKGILTWVSRTRNITDETAVGFRV